MGICEDVGCRMQNTLQKDAAPRRWVQNAEYIAKGCSRNFIQQHAVGHLLPKVGGAEAHSNSAYIQQIAADSMLLKDGRMAQTHAILYRWARLCGEHTMTLKLEECVEDWHGPCARSSYGCLPASP
eukprot:scaffold152411_cov18-Tisochrysis_lutea.AAC.1